MRVSSSSPSTSTPPRTPLRIDTHVSLPLQQQPQPSRPSAYPFYTPAHLRSPATPAPSTSTATPRSAADPYADVTRLRLRPQSHPCLFAGAEYSGTQKSGKSSYDVSVSLCTVDLAQGTLCGFLKIRGLTEDYPELTTFFDAHVVGSGRYGFRSPREWGADAQQDAAHWARFRPRRGAKAIFMRWKERFLVPDHRVRDISGASFAGFYYVCVEYDAGGTGVAPLPRPPRSSTGPLPASRAAPAAPAAGKRERAATFVAEPEPMDVEEFDEPQEDEEELEPGGARMTGFYFHPCSEPFQQLALHLTNRPAKTAWEMR